VNKFLSILFILFSNTSLLAFAETENYRNEYALSYQIKIDRSGYILMIEMHFPKSILIDQFAFHLKNKFSMQFANSKIYNLEILEKNNNNYDSLMTVKTFGLSNKLLSHCRESKSKFFWERNCNLDTAKYDAGRFMIQKSDHVICDYDKNKLVCKFNIRGQMKDLKISYFNIASAEVFAAKAKAESLSQFFKFYYFIESGFFSFSRAEEEYLRSSGYVAVQAFEEKALSKLKAGDDFDSNLVIVEGEK